MNATLVRASGVAVAAAAIDAEFVKLPAMRLTEAQAARLVGLSATDCRSALQLLLKVGRLVCDRNGQYASAGRR